MLDDLLAFWFGDIHNGLCSPEKKKIWYFSNPQLDSEITQRFGHLHRQAADGKLADWLQTAKGTLGVIILLDQLSRNIFRGTGEAFAYDEKALQFCLAGEAQGFPLQLSLIETLFYYHPLEHSESLEHQEMCVSRFKALAYENDGERGEVAQNAYDYACEHRDIIARFGRFPHRNSALGRASTPDELEYLNAGGKRFGQ